MITFFDTTLRDGEQTPGVNFSLREKLEIAGQLERLGVDIIEAGFAIASPGDFAAIESIAGHIKNASVASLSRAKKSDIDASYSALKQAVEPRIHIFLATSDIHLTHKLKMTREQAFEQAVEMVKYAKTLLSNIEFSAEDATRTDPEFLYRIVDGVIKAGAVCVNIPDTVGYTTPREYYDLIQGIITNVPNASNVDISVHCHDDLGQAVANSLSAIKAGARQVECTINGLGERAGNAALEEICMALRTRSDYFKAQHKIDTTQISRTSKLLTTITGIVVPPNKAIVGSNVFAHASGIHQHGVLAEKTTYEIMTPESLGLKQNTIILGKLSGRHAFVDKLTEMGYNLTQEEINSAFERFKIIADKKKTVQEEDIEAIIGENAAKVDEICQLISFHLSIGNKSIATATVEIAKDEEVTIEAATGDGPIDAAFKAISRAIGIELELTDYKIRSITQGQDSLGEANICVLYNGERYKGRGISTDVIEASIKAYINALNRVLNVLVIQ